MRSLVYTNHLYGLGGGARAVEHIARALPGEVDVATKTDVPVQVREWIPDLKIVPYRMGMEEEYDILWNIDHFSYAKPLAKQNYAFIFFPHENNIPPKEYKLYAVSKYTSLHIGRMWNAVSEPLYLPIEMARMNVLKQKRILNVARFATPNQYADKGHRQMLQSFKGLCDGGCDWEMVFIGSLDPGEGNFLNELMQSARGYNVRFLVNADDATVCFYMNTSAVYWHMTGISMLNIPGAQEHYGLSTMEAQAMGTVPIVIKSGGHLETITNGHDGLLVSSPQELTEVTRIVTKDLGKWAMLSQRGMAAGQAWADIDFFNQQMQNILDGKKVEIPQKGQWLHRQYLAADVCAIIPVHNLCCYTERCLTRLWEDVPEMKIILVDNASTDDTPKLKEEIESHGGVYLRREVNDGFATANNAAISYLDRKFVLMINNDVEPIVGNEWLDIMLAEMNDPLVGIVAPKLLFPDGRIQFAGMEGDEETLFRHMGYGQPDSPTFSSRQNTFAVTGACLLTRTEMFGLDETYNLNYEDVDYCLRARDNGYHVIYQPAAVLIHYEGKTKEHVPKAKEMIEASRELFRERHEEMLQ